MTSYTSIKATKNNNGLNFTTKDINRAFKIKIYGYVNGKKVNKLVGVKGLIEAVEDVVLINKMLNKAFNSMDDKFTAKLRRGIKITFYYY